MQDNFSFITDKEWMECHSKMKPIAAYLLRHLRGELGEPEDAVVSAEASFFASWGKPDKRALEALTADAVEKLMYFHLWRKVRRRWRRSKQPRFLEVTFSQLSTDELEFDSPAPVEGMTFSDLHKTLLELFESEPEQRAIADLCIMGYNGREIADKVGIEQHAVYPLLAAIKVRIHAFLIADKSYEDNG